MAERRPFVPLRDALLPPRETGLRSGTALAVGVHVLLVLALALGLHWRVSDPEPFSAELWATLPQVAAPAPPPLPPAVEPTPPAPTPAPAPEPVALPPPGPSAADIALEKEKVERRKREQDDAARKAKQEKVEKDRLAKETRARAEDERKRQDAKRVADQKLADERVEQRREATRKEQVARLLGQAEATGAATSTGTAVRDAAPSASYGGRIKARIKPNIVFTESVSGDPLAEVEVRAAPDGSIVGRRLLKSSGNTEWDEAVLRAIDRTATLPRDVDGRVPSLLVIAFRVRD